MTTRVPFLKAPAGSRERSRLDKLAKELRDLLEPHIEYPPDRDALRWSLSECDLLYFQDQVALSEVTETCEQPWGHCLVGVSAETFDCHVPDHWIFLQRYTPERGIGANWVTLAKYDLKANYDSFYRK